MRFVGQVLSLIASIAGLYVVFAVWAEFPVGVAVAFGVLLVAGVPALVIAYLLERRRTRLPLHGPVRKWGLSEDAIHQRVSEERP